MRKPSKTLPRLVEIQNIARQRCTSCHRDFGTYPAVLIDGSEFPVCFSCAKKIVDFREAALYRKAKDEYEVRQSKFQQEKHAYDSWKHARDEEFSRRNKSRFLWFVGISIVVLLASSGAAWPLVMLAGFYFMMFGLFSNNRAEEQQYQSKFPAPPAPGERPYLLHPRIGHALVKPTAPILSPYRKEVLVRDQNICQWCEITGEDDIFEVHHVLPRVADGKDQMDNLVTLCIPCHKKEDWYGHVHKEGAREERIASRSRAIRLHGS